MTEQELAELDSLILSDPATRDALAKPDISLSEFIAQAWNVVEPGRTYIPNWHIDAIAEHLEAVSSGQITRLIINMPPRHMKSLICSVFWPTWEWTWKPWTRWLTISYANTLSISFATKSRRVINSNWYRDNWGQLYRLSGDQNVKSRYENTYEGIRLATSMLAQITGEGGDRIVIDDPHNVADAESEAIREATVEAFDQGITTRLNDANKGAIVIVGQRVHEMDLCGHLLKQEGWDHLCLPTEYEIDENRKATSIGWRDPRTEGGELLNPQRFDENAIAAAKESLASYGFASQHQQRPAPREGGLIKSKYFQYIDFKDLPKNLRLVRAWDLAATEKSAKRSDPDFTAGVLQGIDDSSKDHYIIDVVEAQLSPFGVEQLIKTTAQKDGQSVVVVIEQEKGASGIHIVEHYQRNILPGYIVRPGILFGDKVVRATAFGAKVEAEKVYIVRAPWNYGYCDQADKFPNGAHKDKIDATSGGFNELNKESLSIGNQEGNYDESDIDYTP